MNTIRFYDTEDLWAKATEASTTLNVTSSTSNTSPNFLSINQPIIVLVNCGKLGIGIQ